MNDSNGNIGNLHVGQAMGRAVQAGRAAAASDQQDLVQPGMAVGSEFPIVQARPGFDGFDMDDIRQIAVIAEQGEVLDMVRPNVHVRKIQVVASPVHSKLFVPMA
ncbi:MAG: hypothetical protein R3D85_14030 [Paracoccaceae bacterium]